MVALPQILLVYQDVDIVAKLVVLFVVRTLVLLLDVAQQCLLVVCKFEGYVKLEEIAFVVVHATNDGPVFHDNGELNV